MYHISLVAHHIITITIILGTTRTIRIQPPVLVVPFQPLTQAAIHRSSVVAFSSSLPFAGGSHRTQSPFSTIHPRRPYRYLHDTNRLIATTTNQMTPRNGEDETGAAVIEDGTEQSQKRPRSTRIQQQQQQQQQQRANVTSVPMVVTPSPKKKRQRSTGTSTIAMVTTTVTSGTSTVRSATPNQRDGSEQRSPRNVIIPMDCPSSSSSLSSLTASTTSRVPATVAVDDDYHDLYIPPKELRPSRTLITGQCFHWRAVVPVPMPTTTTTTTTTPATTDTKNTSNTATTTNAPKSAWGSHNANEWIGNLRVSRSSSHHMYKMAETIIVMIRETPTTTLFRTIYTTNPSLNVRQLLYAYFQFTPSSVSILQQSTNPNEVVLPIETVASSDQHLETDTTANHHQTTTTICLTDLYQEWSAQCDRLSVIASYLPGVRIVDQDPFYCLVSFLCSSNNNIPRITKMLSSLQRTYGTKITTISQAALLSRDDVGISRKEVIGWDEQDVDPTTGDMIIYAFPSLPQLISSFREPDDDDDNNSVLSEANLRTKCGMGYRAKYLMETLQLLHTLGGERYLHELRHSTDPTHVQEQLLQFKGIGRKVADCIALFSLQQHNAIPVDVHVWNIARRDYQADDFWINSPRTTTSSSKPITTSTTKSTKTEQKTKSLTPTIYKQIGDLFRNKFPSYSGWAHSLLFVAELPSFRPALPVDIVSDMDAFREDEKARKVALKQKARNLKAEKEK